MDKKLISIVTPCLNEEANVDKIYTAVKTLFSKKEHYSYEHIFIDNKSNDKTRELLREIAKKDKNVKLIFNTRNFGQWASPYWALQQSKGEAGIPSVMSSWWSTVQPPAYIPSSWTISPLARSLLI